MLTAKDPASGDYRIPRIIYSDAYFSEMVAYADLVLPDTTYLERWDCISLLDRPICSADGPADAIRQPVVAPDRDVRPFQDVLLDLGHRLGLPGMTNDGRQPELSQAVTPTTSSITSASPGSARCRLARRRTAARRARARPTRSSSSATSRTAASGAARSRPRRATSSTPTGPISTTPYGWASSREAEPIMLQLYSEVLQKFRLAAGGPWSGAAARARPRPDPDLLRPAAVLVPAVRGRRGRGAGFPLHAITQRPMAMYHSWGGMNAWLRQIHGSNRLYLNRPRAEALGLADDDWVWITSRHGRIKAQIRLMEGVNPDTCWTWNAIGKRAGAWNLAAERARGDARAFCSTI